MRLCEESGYVELKMTLDIIHGSYVVVVGDSDVSEGWGLARPTSHFDQDDLNACGKEHHVLCN